MTRSILRVLLGAAFAPLAITEDAPSAAGAPTDDAAAGAASASGEANGSASDADGAPASGTDSPAEDAPRTSAAAGAGSAAADQLPAVSFDVEDHAEARERFAGALAALHGIEGDAAAALSAELDAIGTLLHLHSFASSQAGATGSYSPADL
ncbi:hypothetical protein [Burkholderia glumae]|uniref:hypothetical protein n=1 Tax=Burkholderia glumae TaxID=337 RepID=UPI0021648CE1|nr:hypothetical protein [Burkholderia glumae]UVS95660.1 hypothetical protein EFP19_07680 [Burkholderia glumae]